MACHLPATELYDFVKKEKSIQDMRKEFSVDGLQMFLLHFLKTYSRDDLPGHVKRELKLAKKTIRCSVYNMASKSKDLLTSKFFHIDWIFPALGCFEQLYQFPFRNDSEYIFYLLKFRYQQQYSRCPIPKIPFCLSRLVPEQIEMIHDLATLDEEADTNTRVYQPKETAHEEFMMSMRAIEEAAWRGCHHEVLAYATNVLCNENMLFHPYWKKYYFYVWGELAVSLAKLNMPSTFPYSCLEKMKEFAVRCISFELDALLYEQKVASASCKYEIEEKLFLKICKLVPKHSAFLRNSVLVHMSCKKRQIEDMLAEAFARRQDGFDNFNNYFQMDVRKNFMVKFEDSIENECEKHKTLMYKFCSIFKNERKRLIFEQELMLIQLYEELLMSIKYQYGSKSKWNMVAASLATTNCHERHFVSFHNKTSTSENYLYEMMTLKRELEKQTKVNNHQVWANICFTHFLMLKAVDSSAEIKNFFHLEAMKIFSFHNNPRAVRMETHLVQHQQLPPFAFAEHVIEPHCTIQWILRNAPKVKHFVSILLKKKNQFKT
jgi:hypothetical protein